MTSKAEAIFACKNFGSNLLPADKPQVGINTALKKKQGDVTFSLQFNDASLRDPKSGKGVVVSAEKPLGSGVKGTLAYNVGANDVIGTVTADAKIFGKDATVKVSYQHADNVLVVHDTLKLNKQNKLVGTYNFLKKEDSFSYEHIRGSLKLGALYSFKTEKKVLSIEKKNGKDTLTAAYSLEDELTTLSWQHKPFKAALKGKAGKMGVKGMTASLTLTHEFEL